MIGTSRGRWVQVEGDGYYVEGDGYIRRAKDGNKVRWANVEGDGYKIEDDRGRWIYVEGDECIRGATGTSRGR